MGGQGSWCCVRNVGGASVRRIRKPLKPAFLTPDRREAAEGPI